MARVQINRVEIVGSSFDLPVPFLLEVLYFFLFFLNLLKIFELLLFCCFLPVDRFTEFVRIGVV
jgi:hypothetical protein